MNKMKDLKAEVQQRLRPLDGQVVEDYRNVRVEALLGIIDIGETPGPETRDGTLLDPSHGFWQEYVRDILSSKDAEQEVRYAIRLLRDEEKVEVLDPEDSELKGVYVTVEPLTERDAGLPPGYSIDFVERNATSGLVMTVTAPDGTVYERSFHRK